MTKTLKELELEHPEWCFRCGHREMSAPFHSCYKCHVINILTGAKLEDEKRIAELEEGCKRVAEEIGQACADECKKILTAEREAHAATKEELRKADEALIISRQLVSFLEHDEEGRYNYAHEKAELVYAAHQSAVARRASRQASINRPTDKQPTDDSEPNKEGDWE